MTGGVMNRPKLIFCESCKESKPWSTIYAGLQSRGVLMAVCPSCAKYLDRKDKEQLENG